MRRVMVLFAVLCFAGFLQAADAKLVHIKENLVADNDHADSSLADLERQSDYDYEEDRERERQENMQACIDCTNDDPPQGNPCSARSEEAVAQQCAKNFWINRNACQLSCNAGMKSYAYNALPCCNFEDAPFVATCYGYTCPANSSLKSAPSSIPCAGAYRTCDTQTCCDSTSASSTCEGYACPANYLPKSNASSITCDGTCDKGTCCTPTCSTITARNGAATCWGSYTFRSNIAASTTTCTPVNSAMFEGGCSNYDYACCFYDYR